MPNEPIPVPRWIVNFVSWVLIILISGAVFTVCFTLFCLIGLGMGQTQMKKSIDKVEKQIQKLD